MHSHKPYWSAVFHFCRAFKDFLPDPSAPHAAPHRLESRMLPPQGRCRPPLSLLSSLPLNPNTSEGKAVSNNVETASREFLDTANAFYLPCAQQAGCIEKPKYFEKTRVDLTRVTSLESSNLLTCLPTWGLVFLP